jgi:hypothetical protein
MSHPIVVFFGFGQHKTLTKSVWEFGGEGFRGGEGVREKSSTLCESVFVENEKGILINISLILRVLYNY